MGERGTGIVEGCGLAVVLLVVVMLAGCCGLTWWGGRITDQLDREREAAGAR